MTDASSQPRSPRVFLSYSHDSAEHENRVLSLANRLRREGVDARIDQYESAPPNGWPHWMDLEIQNADFVLLACTETYLRRVERREGPGKGRGVAWESMLIYNLLYVSDAPVQKFIPILWDPESKAYIPSPLRGMTHYQVSIPEGYENLYRHLTKQPRHLAPTLGCLTSLPAIEPQSYPPSPVPVVDAPSREAHFIHDGFCWRLTPEFFPFARGSRVPYNKKELDERVLGPFCPTCGFNLVQTPPFFLGDTRVAATALNPCTCGWRNVDAVILDMDIWVLRQAVYVEAQRRLNTQGLAAFTPGSCPDARPGRS